MAVLSLVNTVSIFWWVSDLRYGMSLLLARRCSSVRLDITILHTRQQYTYTHICKWSCRMSFQRSETAHQTLFLIFFYSSGLMSLKTHVDFLEKNIVYSVCWHSPDWWNKLLSVQRNINGAKNNVKKSFTIGLTSRLPIYPSVLQNTDTMGL